MVQSSSELSLSSDRHSSLDDNQTDRQSDFEVRPVPIVNKNQGFQKSNYPLKKSGSSTSSFRQRDSNYERDDEIEELNQSLRKTLSLTDAFEMRNSITDAEQLPDVEKVFTNRSSGQLALPPDGGLQGWVNVLCFLVSQASTWGANAGSTSVLLAFYIDNDVFPGATRLDFAWITGLVMGLGQFNTPFGLILHQIFGFKTTMITAATLNLISYMLAAQATKIWHLYLTQGLLTGMVLAPTFAPMGTIIPKWFLKRRASATGLSLAGTGLGGLIYSLATDAVIKRTGDQKWALRMVGISSWSGSMLAILLARENPPNFEVPKRPKPSFKQMRASFSYMFQRKVLLDKRFYYILFWFDCTFCGYLLLVYSFASYATAMGYSQAQGSNLGAILNAAQVVGRPVMGFISDKYVGRINYSIILSFVAGIFTFAFWINAKTFGALVGLTICFGFVIGVGNVMNMVIIADVFGPVLFASSWAFLNLLNGIPAAFVEVIVLKLRDDSLSNPYIYCQIFVGVIYFCSIVGLIPIREYIIRERLESKRRHIKAHDNSNEKDDTEADLVLLDALLEDSFLMYLKRSIYPMKI